MANWYSYIGIGDPTSSTSYRVSNVKPNCNTGVQICAVYLNQTDPIPSAFDGVSTYIANALATQIAQPSPAGQKRFVYLKCGCG